MPLGYLCCTFHRPWTYPLARSSKKCGWTGVEASQTLRVALASSGVRCEGLAKGLGVRGRLRGQV